MGKILFTDYEGNETGVSRVDRAKAYFLQEDYFIKMLLPFVENNTIALKSIIEFLSEDSNNRLYRGISVKKALKNLFTATGGMSKKKIELYSIPVSVEHLYMNNVIRYGTDAERFLVRLDAQCEIHAYILPEHRGRTVSAIQQGLDSGLYDDTSGWEKVIELIRNSPDDRPVVTSYTVCDEFPDYQYVKKSSLDTDIEAFYDMSHSERFSLAFKGVLLEDRENEHPPRNIDVKDTEYCIGIAADIVDVLMHSLLMYRDKKIEIKDARF